MPPVKPLLSGNTDGLSRFRGSEIHANIPGSAHGPAASAAGDSYIARQETGSDEPISSTRLSIFSDRTPRIPSTETPEPGRPAGVRGLLAGRIPTDKHFAAEFREATGYGLDRFLRLGFAREAPPKMGERIWLQLVGAAVEEQGLVALLADHPRNGTPQQEWEHEVERAAAGHTLRSLASSYVPTRITKDDWDRYVDLSIGSGQPEYVVAEPLTRKQVEAIVPAYRFLRSRGIEIDPVEYLRAIYPLFDEMMSSPGARGADGAAVIRGPLSVLFDDPEHSLTTEEFSYRRLAERIRMQGFPTLVLSNTLGDHANGDVLPTYESVARYADALAAGVHALPEEQRAIYLFVAAVPRVMRFLGEISRIHRPDGNAINAGAGASAPAVHIADDGVQYPTGFRAPSGNRWDALRLDVRRGRYRALLGHVLDYAGALSLIDSSDAARISILLPDNTHLEVGQLLSYTARFAADMDEMDRTLVGSEPPAESKERSRVEQFYLGMRELADRVFFYMRPSGAIESNSGEIPFIAAARIEGQRIRTDGTAVVFLNDIARISREEGWENGRAFDLVRMRVMAQHALETGALDAADVTDPEAIERATGAMLAEPLPGWHQAALDFVRLEAMGLALHLQDTSGEVSRNRRAEAAAEIDRMRSERSADAEARAPSPGEKIEQWLGGRAALAYAAIMPEEISSPSAIPMDERLLRLLVEIECEQHPDANRDLVMATARDAIARFNSQRRSIPTTPSTHASQLPSDGRFESRFAVIVHEWRRESGNERTPFNEHAVRNAWFTLRERVAAGETIGVDEISAAITAAANGARASGQSSRTNGVESSILARLIARQQADLQRWNSLVTDPEFGLAAFVSREFRAPGITRQGLEEFAQRYAARRLTSIHPADVDSLSADAVGSALAPFAEIAERMAGNYRMLLSRWFDHVGAMLSSRVQDGIDAVETAAIDKEHAPKNIDELRQNAAELAGVDSFESFESARQNLLLLRELVPGRMPQHTTLDETARSAFEEMTKPALAEIAAAQELENAEWTALREEELAKVSGRAAAAATRSAELLAQWRQPQDVSSMDHDAAKAYVARAEAGIKILSDAETELSALSTLFEDAVSLDGSSDRGAAIEDEIRRNLEDAKRDFDQATDIILNAHEDATARRDVTYRLLEKQQLENRARAAIADAHKLSLSLEGDAAAAEAIRTDELPEIEGGFREISAGLRRTDLNYATFSGLALEADRLTSSARNIAERALAIGAEITSVTEVPPGEDRKSAAGAAAGKVIDAARHVDEGTRRETNDAVAELGEAKQKAHDSLARINLMSARAAQIETELAEALRAAESSLPFAPPASLPEPAASPNGEIDILRHSFVNAIVGEGSQIKARTAIDPVISGSVISVRGSSYLLPRAEAARARAWLSGDRAGPLALRDVFDNELRLEAGEVGIKLARNRAELPSDHPLAILQDTLEAAVNQPGGEAALLASLAMSKQGKIPGTPQRRLLLDLYAAVARSGRVSGNAGARAAVRRWALDHREEISREINGAERRFFRHGRSIPSANEPIHPQSYTERSRVEHEMRYENILDRPELGVMIVKPAGEPEQHHYVNVEMAGRLISEGSSSVPVFDLDRGLWMTYERPANGEIKIGIENAPISLQPARIALMRLLQRIYGDPQLMDLGFLSSIATMTTPLYNFLNSTMMTMARALHLPQSRQPMDLMLLQSEAVAAFRELTLRPGAGLNDANPPAPFAAPDAELARQFPETGLVGGSQLWSVMERLSDGTLGTPPLLSRLMEIFPNFAGALALITITRDRLGPGIMDELGRLAAEHIACQAYGSAAELPALRDEFIRIYAGHADEIADALVAKQPDGTTLAQWILGTDNFRGDWTGVEGLSPAERLVITAPEFGAMDDRNVAPILRRLGESIDSMSNALPSEKNPIKWMLAFAEARPEFGKAVALLGILLDRLPQQLRYDGIFMFFATESAPWNNPALAAAMTGSDAAALDPGEAFVRMLTEPKMLSALRNAMQMPLPGMMEPTVAEIFLGSAKPWIYSAPASPLLPASDLADMDALSEEALAARIEERVGALGLVQEAARRFGPMKPRRLQHGTAMEQMIGLWQVREESLAMDNRGAVVIVDLKDAEQALIEMAGSRQKDTVVVAGSEAARIAFVKIILLLDETDRALGLTLAKNFRMSAVQKEFKNAAELLRFAYRYLIEQRKPILSAANIKTGGRGSKGGGSSIPPPPSAPPVPPSPSYGGLPPAAANARGSFSSKARVTDVIVTSGSEAVKHYDMAPEDAECLEAGAMDAMELGTELMMPSPMEMMPAATFV